MRHVNLPHTDLQVSVIAMGCWALAGDMTWGPQSEADSIDAVRAALDAGINFFDTAPGYGNGLSEERLGKDSRGDRHRAVVATKIGPDAMRARDVAASVEKSLERLGTDHVDLIQIHWPSREVPFEETWAALETLREQGKARAIGVSNFGRGDLSDALTVGHPTTNQVPYSLLTRAIEYEVIPTCESANVGVLCYSPLAWSLLTGKYGDADDVPSGRARSRHFSAQRPLTRHGEPGCEAETFEALRQIRAVARRLDVSMSELAVAWLLHQPRVTSVLTGIRNSVQAADNARAARLELDPEALADLARATEPVKRSLGQNPDPWQNSENSRYR